MSSTRGAVSAASALGSDNAGMASVIWRFFKPVRMLSRMAGRNCEPSSDTARKVR